MAPWIPFVLLPLYFAALAVALIRFAPQTADAPSPAAEAPSTQAAESAVAPEPSPPTMPTERKPPIAAGRERPRHGEPASKS